HRLSFRPQGLFSGESGEATTILTPGVAAKVGLLIGSLCIVSYLLINGHFPQGVSLGDSLLFSVAAFCFGVVCLYFSVSVTAAGLLLSPLFIPLLKLFSWIKRKFGKDKSTLDFKWQRIGLLSVFFGLCGVAIIYFIAHSNPIEHLPLIVLPLFQYIVYTAFSEQNSKVKAARQADLELGELKSLKKIRAMMAALLILTPILMGGVTSDLLQAAMSVAQIRIEKATILVKQPFADLLPEPKDSPLPDYKTFEQATVVFRGIGDSTLIEVRTPQTAIRLEVPNDSIIIERRGKLLAKVDKRAETTEN
ncbi:hypothetical protein, partial [Pseudomonas citri]|uniref:hypothetical protein n=1 Tax=Pseudomonas citri TaxID=2978349 RepID=UPI0028CB4FF1